MATFRYNGEPDRPLLVKAMGDTVKMRLRLKDGIIYDLLPGISGKFAKDDLIEDITDERVIRHMNGDPRFTQVG